MRGTFLDTFRKNPGFSISEAKVEATNIPTRMIKRTIFTVSLMGLWDVMIIQWRDRYLY